MMSRSFASQFLEQRHGENVAKRVTLFKNSSPLRIICSLKFDHIFP